eukprot:1523141-Pleurochrysis_carterae.AAC.2
MSCEPLGTSYSLISPPGSAFAALVSLQRWEPSAVLTLRWQGCDPISGVKVDEGKAVLLAASKDTVTIRLLQTSTAEGAPGSLLMHGEAPPKGCMSIPSIACTGFQQASQSQQANSPKSPLTRPPSPRTSSRPSSPPPSPPPSPPSLPIPCVLGVEYTIISGLTKSAHPDHHFIAQVGPLHWSACCKRTAYTGALAQASPSVKLASWRAGAVLEVSYGRGCPLERLTNARGARLLPTAALLLGHAAFELEPAKGDDAFTYVATAGARREARGTAIVALQGRRMHAPFRCCFL